MKKTLSLLISISYMLFFCLAIVETAVGGSLSTTQKNTLTVKIPEHDERFILLFNDSLKEKLSTSRQQHFSESRDTKPQHDTSSRIKTSGVSKEEQKVFDILKGRYSNDRYKEIWFAFQNSIAQGRNLLHQWKYYPGEKLSVSIQDYYGSGENSIFVALSKTTQEKLDFLHRMRSGNLLDEVNPLGFTAELGKILLGFAVINNKPALLVRVQPNPAIFSKKPRSKRKALERWHHYLIEKIYAHATQSGINTLYAVPIEHLIKTRGDKYAAWTEWTRHRNLIAPFNTWDTVRTTIQKVSFPFTQNLSENSDYMLLKYRAQTYDNATLTAA